jgi:hypothetical protein
MNGKIPVQDVRAISFRCVVRNHQPRKNNVGLGRCASPGLLVMRPAQSQQKRTLKRQYCRKNDLLTLNANRQELSVERLFSFDYVETHFPGW